MPDVINPALIEAVGFPGFVCLILFWFIKVLLTNQQNMLNDLKTTLAQNTETLRIIAAKLDKE